MPVVVDANLLVALVTSDPRSEAVTRRFREWLDSGVDVHAPVLLQYEVANALTRIAAAGVISGEDLPAAWNAFIQIPITFHPIESGEGVISIALVLKRQRAYDAAYLALASELGAELWTMDGPLHRNASQHGYPVRLIS